MDGSPAPGAANGTLIPQPLGPPYLPQVAPLGGLPTVALDDPICAVLLFVFVVGAVVNMAIFQINRRRDHKFLFSILLCVFCLARIAALSLRIAWVSDPMNLNVAIAANVFVAAGVLLLYIINLIFAQRIVRAYHPHFGWSPWVSWSFRALYVTIGALLVMVITATVHSFFTLDPNAREADRIIQLFGSTFLAALAFLPIPIVVISVLWDKLLRPSAPEGAHPGHLLARSGPEKFGQGRLRTKLALLLSTSALLALGAGFRTGVAYSPRPITQPAWYHHKACYYVFNYGVELIVVFAYTISRFDSRFHVPDGSSGPGHYSGADFTETSGPGETNGGGVGGVPAHQRIFPEADVFGGSLDAEGVGVYRNLGSAQSARSARSARSTTPAGGYLSAPAVPAGRDCEKEWEDRAREELLKRVSVDYRQDVESRGA